MIDCCIVGAGISGLTLAYALEKRGLSCAIFEASARPGGMIRSHAKNGFLIELGPNSLLGKRAARALCEELGLNDEILSPSTWARRKYLAVERRGAPLELTETPSSPLQLLTSPILTISAKLRLLGDLFAPRGESDDESVECFVSRRFGRNCAARVVAPLLGGIWAADIGKLSCRSALPRAWKLERDYGSLLLGILREHLVSRQSSGDPRSSLLSFRSGMEALPQALAYALRPSTLQLETRVTRLSLVSPGVRVGYQSRQGTGDLLTRCAVLAIESVSTAELIRPINASLADAILQVPYAPLGILHLAVPTRAVAHPLDGFGFLIPPSTKTPLLGVIFSSSLFPGRAPTGTELLTCFAGGAVKPALSAVNHPPVQTAIIGEVERLLRISREPEVINATVYERSIPNYAVGHYCLQEKVAAFERAVPQLRFLGNWLRGTSVPDRIDEAERLASEIVLSLENRRSASDPIRNDSSQSPVAECSSSPLRIGSGK